MMLRIIAGQKILHPHTEEEPTRDLSLNICREGACPTGLPLLSAGSVDSCRQPISSIVVLIERGLQFFPGQWPPFRLSLSDRGRDWARSVDKLQ